MGPYVNGSRVAGFTPCLSWVRIRRGMWRVLSWEVGVVERRSEEQGVEAGSSPTQLAVRQSVVPLLRQPHPPPLRTVSGRVAPCATVWAIPERREPGGDAESGGSLRSVGEVAAQRAVDQVREPSFEAAEGFAAGFAFGSFALVVGAAFGVCGDLGDRNGVERPVELPVAAAVEAVSYGSPRRCGDGCCSVGGGEVVPGGVAADVDDVADDGGRNDGADGANVKAVQQMLGHASAAMTLDVYAGLFADDLDSVADQLDRALARTGPTKPSCPLRIRTNRPLARQTPSEPPWGIEPSPTHCERNRACPRRGRFLG
jgi:hypothetical protein